MSADDLYRQAGSEFGAALERLARSYEANADVRRDLLQEIHLALWRSLEGFRGQCSLRTWVYRVAHNAGVTHVLRQRRATPLVSLDDIDEVARPDDVESAYSWQSALDRMYALIAQLRPLDREVVLLYLEGLHAGAIAEITGISARNVATKVHRIKKILASRFPQGATHAAIR